MKLSSVLACVFVTAAWCGSGPFASARSSEDGTSSLQAAQPPRLVLTDDATELDAALAARTPPHNVAVRVAGVSLPDADPAKARLLILAEIGGAEAGLAADATAKAGATRTSFRLASVAYVIENDRGQAIARGLRRRELSWAPNGTLAFSETVTLPPGSYWLKLGAMRNAKVGVAQAAVAVRVQSVENLRFGDVVVGEAAGDDLGSSLAIDRLIRGDSLVASLPFATSDPSLPPGAAITVDVSKEANGPAMLSVPAAVRQGQDALSVAQAVVDVRALPPGQYFARATLSLGGKEAIRTSAPFTRERVAATGSGAAAGTPATARSRAVARPIVVAAFRADDVLDASVLGPFLEDLAGRATERSKPAIEHAKAGRFAEAVQAAESADPNDPVKPFLRGLSLLSQKQLQPASEAFRETLRAAPDYFAGAFYIGACYAAGGRDPQAVSAWQTSLVGLEQFPIVFRLLADALMRMGQPARALETLDEAMGKWPADPGIRLRTAKAALDATRYDRVYALVDETLTGQPQPDLLFTGLQATYEQAGQRADPAGDEMLARAHRYRDAYVAAGGPQQALVAEWMAALDRRK